MEEITIENETVKRNFRGVSDLWEGLNRKSENISPDRKPGGFPVR